MKTFSAHKNNTDVAKKKWFLVDAKGKILGRMSAKVASVIRGKHKTTYTPNFDVGDYVIVVNAQQVKVTGRKMQEKMYLHYSGYPGGLKQTSLEVMLKTKPEEVIRSAVRRMLPAGPLSRVMLKKLKVFAGSQHPYEKKELSKLEV